MPEIKPCKVCDFTRQKYYGVVAVSLSQLKAKGSEALGYTPDTSVSVVLDDDGTVVDDEAYFLCIPPNTKFMFLQDKEIWKPTKRYDGGTAWLSQSFDVGSDAVDSTHGAVEPWHALADQLRQDLSSIILMSEAHLQVGSTEVCKSQKRILHEKVIRNVKFSLSSFLSLVAVPCTVLASALTFPEQKTKDLQDTLQRVLDRREEARQSKELLQLYLSVVEKERSQDLQQSEAVMDEVDGSELDSGVGFNARTLLVLKSKTNPETRLSNEELQMVLKQGTEMMTDKLGWDRDRTVVLLQSCEEELNKRLQQVQAMHSLSAHSHCSNSSSASTTEPEEEAVAKHRK